MRRLIYRVVICIKWVFSWHGSNVYEPSHEKMCLITYVNNKDAAEPAHPRSLISSFVVQRQDRSLYIRNFKILVGLCSWAGQFVSSLARDSRRHIFSWRGSYVLSFQIWWNLTRGSIPVKLLMRQGKQPGTLISKLKVSCLPWNTMLKKLCTCCVPSTDHEW